MEAKWGGRREEPIKSRMVGLPLVASDWLAPYPIRCIYIYHPVDRGLRTLPRYALPVVIGDQKNWSDGAGSRR